jgi:hypothetical protein
VTWNELHAGFVGAIVTDELFFVSLSCSIALCLVEITSKGRRIIERASIEHEKHMERAFRALSRSQRLQLVL